ncbi:hypothetical protein CH380_14435 [Leptospira adleri]|uniref:Uncharacterized protein n=1 Tax=Leptospira adleri TaxID=2023186 RepID=A0A2M9YM58_9LEPT|nr:hypothetical protein CH380_14435 [Leptospira adleri]PJZ60371.1 hypothetical protein CH376_18855 [Leptospira adleri]
MCFGKVDFLARMIRRFFPAGLSTSTQETQRITPIEVVTQGGAIVLPSFVVVTTDFSEEPFHLV